MNCHTIIQAVLRSAAVNRQHWHRRQFFDDWHYKNNIISIEWCVVSHRQVNTDTGRTHAAHTVAHSHWRRLVKNIGGNPNLGGEQNVVKTDKCMGVPRFWGRGARPGCPPKSTHMHIHIYLAVIHHTFHWNFTMEETNFG